MTKRRNYEELCDIELSKEQAELINKFIVRADKDIEESKYRKFQIA